MTEVSRKALSARVARACVALAAGLLGALTASPLLAAEARSNALGMSFVWLGIAVLVLPTPGGKAPAFVKGIMSLKIQYQLFGYNLIPPFPVIAAFVIAFLVHCGLMRSSYGAVLRGAGGNPRALARALGFMDLMNGTATKPAPTAPTAPVAAVRTRRRSLFTPSALICRMTP